MEHFHVDGHSVSGSWNVNKISTWSFDLTQSHKTNASVSMFAPTFIVLQQNKFIFCKTFTNKKIKQTKQELAGIAQAWLAFMSSSKDFTKFSAAQVRVLKFKYHTTQTWLYPHLTFTRPVPWPIYIIIFIYLFIYFIYILFLIIWLTIDWAVSVDHVLVDGELELHLLPEAVDGRRVDHAARHLLVKVLVHGVVEVGRVTLRVVWVLNSDILWLWLCFSLLSIARRSILGYDSPIL